MKKTNFKRFIAGSLALAMLLSTACSNEESSKATTTTQPDTQGNLLDQIHRDDGEEDTFEEGTYYDQPFENPETDAQVIIENGEFTVKGEEIWFNSVNTPWDNWNDFGGSFDPAFWDSHFADLKNAGINATRIWINCNGIVGVKINEDGSFDSVTNKHWQHLDKLMELAAKHEIYVMATLLSFDHFKDSNNGYQNWRNMITNSDNIEGFVEGYVVPFVKRYDDNDYLWSIDLMNEPDWVFENAECGQISWDNISEYFGKAADAIHDNSDVLVTVGFGIVKYNSDKYNGNMASAQYLKFLSGEDNAYIDFNSTHYYHWQNPWYGFPFTQSPEDFGLDTSIPCVIGECASLDESGVPIGEKYSDAYDNGWDGVFAWTSNGVDACGGYLDIAPSAQEMYEKIPEEVFPLED